MDPDQTPTNPATPLEPVIETIELPTLEPSTLQPSAEPEAPPKETLEPSTLEPSTVPEPVTFPEPMPEPVIVEPSATPEPEPSKSSPLIPQPQVEPVPPPATLEPSTLPPVTVPTSPTPPTEIDINTLSDEQLRLASALYAKKNQKALSQKGVEKRQAIASQNISEITAFIGAHSPASNRTIARALNLPPRRVQHYMQILTHNGTVTATGWGASREYFKK